jgi:hypothetical protein
MYSTQFKHLVNNYLKKSWGGQPPMQYVGVSFEDNVDCFIASGIAVWSTKPDFSATYTAIGVVAVKPAEKIRVNVYEAPKSTVDQQNSWILTDTYSVWADSTNAAADAAVVVAKFLSQLK